MARSFDARNLLGRLPRISAAAAGVAGRVPVARPGGGRSARGAGMLAGPAAVRALGSRALGRLARTPIARSRRSALACAAAALVLLGGGYMALRSSPFVAVEHVRISGVSGPEAGAIESSLQVAARRMGTLDVSVSALRAAVAQYPVVAGLRVKPSFPHGLLIDVQEQLPVAVLSSRAGRTAVAADGAVLGTVLVSGSLPVIAVPALPAPGTRLTRARLLSYLSILGAVPHGLLRFVAGVSTGVHGVTLSMRNGLTVYFGDAQRPHAKWMALADVLADASSAGAVYVDVRLPSRPAAGFPGGVVPDASEAEAAAAEATGGSEQSTVASLAASLAQGSGVSASQSATATSTTTPTSSSAASSPSATTEPGSSQGEAQSTQGAASSTTEAAVTPGAGTAGTSETAQAGAPGSGEASPPAAGTPQG